MAPCEILKKQADFVSRGLFGPLCRKRQLGRINVNKIYIFRQHRSNRQQFGLFPLSYWPSLPCPGN